MDRSISIPDGRPCNAGPSSLFACCFNSCQNHHKFITISYQKRVLVLLAANKSERNHQHVSTTPIIISRPTLPRSRGSTPSRGQQRTGHTTRESKPPSSRHSYNRHAFAPLLILDPFIPIIPQHRALIPLATCEVCGEVFNPAFDGISEPGIYAYCFDCCHW
jgi:hypothetical protein